MAVGLVVPPYRTGRDVLQPPGPEHWLGTNDIGQDVLIGLMHAMPNTVFIAVSAALISLAAATTFACLAAIGGTLVATAVLRTVDILQVIPSILLLLLFAAWLQPGIAGIVLLLALTTWHEDVRVLRAIVLRELTRENVRYARHMGAGWSYCVTHHIVPAVWPTLVGLYVQNIRQAVMKAAGIAFLGLTDPRLTTWGSMMQDSLDHLHGDAWRWLLLPPALSLSLFLLIVLAVGQRLERQTMAGATARP
ncbi:ABC transporter permease [Rhodobium orientis]|uniref:ABC transporter permease n=2 Tax=Rhodobium orientis TaxID=34017 RepID=A0A327JF05_9HYPH|nr:ABC transporter permease [Rhodobium orientis]MBK5951708.1 ABC transporter permease [Rhodobium orientis]RAI24997.1 ABC transporter permease [Rhodobium orientis]